MTPNAAGHAGPANGQARSRPLISSSTIILPSGQRVKRGITFGPRSQLESGDDDGEGEDEDEMAPLLGHSSSSKASKIKRLAMSFPNYLRKRAVQAWEFAISPTGKGVFKCSIAYVLGSLATFVPPIYHSLGPQEGKHVVATITVYYHPARSVGSAFEAILCSSVAWLYVAIISFASMGVSIFFGRTLHLVPVGHIIVLIVFVGGGLGFVGWVKQRMSHALINISCSLAALALITVLTKEGAIQASEFSDDKVVQTLLMVLMGVAASTATALFLFPVSSRTSLRSDLVKATDAFGDMLAITTRSFLKGNEDELKQDSFSKASESYKKVFTSMTKNLKEAKYEHYFLGTEKEYQLQVKLVKCLQRLAQSAGGLQSAAETQFLLLSQPTVVANKTYSSNRRVQKRMSSYVSFDGALSSGTRTPTTIGGFHSLNQSLHSDADQGLGIQRWPASPEEDDADSEDERAANGPINSPSDIFTRFIIRLGPSMKSLAVTMVKILDELPFDSKGKFTADPNFASSLDEAIRLYSESRRNALDTLYKSQEFTQTKSMEMQADFEEVAASCGYFSFSLLDFANEINVYLDILDELRLEVEERPNGRSWSWLKIWKSQRFHRERTEDTENLLDANNATDVPGDMPTPTQRRVTLPLPQPSTKIEALRLHIWRKLSFFRRDDVKFAIKVGIGAAIYALPAFLYSTRDFYVRWRGHWGLLSYMLVCTMTLGASNVTAWDRIIGTCMGASLAILSWTVSGGNPYLLCFFGWIMAYWTAYIIVAKGKGPFGRFIVLTYNLSALYAYSYSISDGGDDNPDGLLDPRITDIASHRTAAVISGCLWGLIVTRLIWPISARRKMKEGLAILWLRMGLLWRRDPLTLLIKPAKPRPYMDLNEELDLQEFLTRLEKLKGSAASEMDIRGPFPGAAMGRILNSTGTMLNVFHAMNILITKNPKATKGEAEILRYTASERDSLCARISHLFQVLASSMKLEFPMNGALPSVHHTRDRLLMKIFRFRQEEMSKSGVTDEDLGIIYAYALVTGQLAEEIKKIGQEIEDLFGVLNEDLLKLQ